MKKVLCISFPASSNNGVGYFDYYNKNQNAEFYYFRKSIKTFFSDYISVMRKALKCQVIIINYVSLFLLLGPLLRCFFKKVVFIPHEGEPLFPKQFKRAIPFPRSLISSLFLSRICVKLASETYCLSTLQAKYLRSNEDKVIRFGINPDFLKKPLLQRQGCFFPNRKNEEIKGFELIKKCHSFIINNNHQDLNASEMASFYAEAKIVLIPSLIETYSYCMVEAMLANCIVLTTKDVGLAYDFFNKYDEETLKRYGLFIFDSADLMVEYLLKNKELLERQESNTHGLAIEFGLSGEAAQSVLNELIEK